MNEENIISLAKKIYIPSPFIQKSIDDDTAVVLTTNNNFNLFTSDMLVEGTHFLFDTISPYDLGWKSLSVNLSDIAAMGGIGRGCLLSIGLPDNPEDKWLKSFFKGFHQCSKTYNTPLIGGDTVYSGHGIIINVAVWGECERPVYRTGIKSGYSIIITGEPGFAAAGLWISGQQKFKKKYKKFLDAFYHPCPQIETGQIISKLKSPVSMLDSSDGLVRSLEIMCEQNKLGAVIKESNLPVCPELKELAKTAGIFPLDWILYGGEDYILIFAIPYNKYVYIQKKLQTLNIKSYEIGYFTNELNGVNILNNKGLINQIPTKQYFQHFR